MSFLNGLPPDAGLLRIFQAFPKTAQPLIAYHEVLMRGESPFTNAERELRQLLATTAQITSDRSLAATKM